MSISISSIFLISVLVLGLASYPSIIPNLDQDISTSNFQLPLGNTVFAQEENGEENGEEEKKNPMKAAEDAITDAQEEIDKAREKIVEATEKGEETSLAGQQLDEAVSKLQMAEQSFDLGNFEEAEELAVEAKDIASEARMKFLGKTLEDLQVQEQEEFEDEVDEAEPLLFNIETPELKIRAETLGDQSEVKVKLKFSTSNTDIDSLIDEIIDEFSVTREQADDALKIEEEDDEELEEKFEVEVKIEDGIADVEVELRFVLDSTDREDILDAIVENTQLTTEQIQGSLDLEIEEEAEEEEEEIEIEVEVEDGVAKVKVEFNDEKHRFLVTDDTSEDGIAAAILNELPDFPLDEAGIMEIWDFEVEEEGGPTLHTTTEFNEWEAEQQAQELYEDLLEKINELEERIQSLLEKYDSGEYYGNVPEVDSEIKSYTISFTGSATSENDDSISSPVEGTIYIDTLMTGQDTSKYIVTGGEISIDDNTFYEFIFGKIRVSPSGSVMLIGQVIDWADESDDSSTIKLVIQSDVPLEGGFGSESLNIEILPQSTIAGQWHLSGSGSLSII